jgi:site-specific recombinase XerD
MPITAAADQWLAHIRRHTPRTQELYGDVTRRFVKTLNISRLNQLSLADIIVYIDQLKMKNISKNAHITVLKAFFRYLSDMYGIENHAKKVQYLKVDPHEARCLTKQEYLQLVKANPPHIEAIKFLANTGLRSDEFRRTPISAVNGRWLRVVGKGRKVRMIPLNKVAFENVSSLNLSMSKSGLWKAMQRAARIADIPPFGPHALRHYFASQLLMHGVPIMQVSKIVGHASVITTEKIYFHYHHQTYLQGVSDCLE